jgi:hypothetical protein
MKDEELTRLFKQQLPALLPAAFTVEKLGQEVRLGNGNQADLQATVKTPTRRFIFTIEVKSADRVAPMREAAYQVKRYALASNTTPMVAGRFLGERTRQVLKDEGVSYIDLAGNFYLKQDNFYAEKIVDKNPFSNTPPLKNIFAPISSRITRAMLIEPKRGWTISELSKETAVSLGQTYNILEAMRKEELAAKDTLGKWTVSNPVTLLEAWKKVYPTYQNRKYTFFSYENSYKAILNSVVAAGERDKTARYALGFFSGAALVAPFTRGQTTVQFYARSDDIDQWKRQLKLQEVQSGGNVEIYVPYDQGVFYGARRLPGQVEKVAGETDTAIGVQIVSDVQLYMDLFNNPARGEEAAEFLRGARLKY